MHEDIIIAEVQTAELAEKICRALQSHWKFDFYTEAPDYGAHLVWCKGFKPTPCAGHVDSDYLMETFVDGILAVLQEGGER